MSGGRTGPPVEENILAMCDKGQVAEPGRRQGTTAGLAALLLAALAAPQAAGAAEQDDYDFEATAFGGYRFGGDFEAEEGEGTIELDDRGSFGFILNGEDSTRTQWEVYYSRQATDADTSDVPDLPATIDVDVQNVLLGGTYQWDGELARPFMSAGVGGTYIAPDASGLDSDTFWAFSIGTGLQFFEGRRWGLRLEARGVGTLVDSESKIFCASGAAGGACAFQLKGRVFWQLETFAGVTFRF
jgi:hypothetical protein